jgi:hypothetical protein
MGSLSVTFSLPSGPINLTAQGTSDWIAWNQSTTERKSSGGSQISTDSVVAGVGTILVGPYNVLGFSWTDGTPDASLTSELGNNYISVGTANAGLQFTAPADTNLRTLLVYAAQGGGVAGTCKFTAALSDASATTYVDTTNLSTGGGSGVNGLYTITYSANSSGQTLNISNVNNATSGSVAALSAAALQMVIVVDPPPYGIGSKHLGYWPIGGLG